MHIGKNITWKVRLIQRGSKQKDVTITLGPASDKVDVFNELRRRGIGGEVIWLRKAK